MTVDRLNIPLTRLPPAIAKWSEDKAELNGRIITEV
jgi:hypothetical protein